MKYYFGFDASLTGSGACIIDENYKIIKVEKFHTKITSIERLFHLRNKLELFLEEYKKEIVMTCIEGYAYGKAGQETGKVFEIGEWGGVAKLFLFENGFEYISAVPLQTKKYSVTSTVKKGSYSKGLMLLNVYKTFNQSFDDDNEADAYVLARIAKDYYNKEKNLTKPQQEVIKAINKSISEGNIGVFLK